ncbi:MAG: hypothetical protein BIP78_1466 [Candidatus Bipolaricaulis sibiricus]|uniref:Alpha-galactosidase NEW3 domain-containing protein n=1 Tax=Bipolaricaulis sibiricus TaxID=2501609 RepID=A0A410FW78_BIPS1|nr:MAG: hypothetical protein BIP78_1466 [Candidatus Bipolaricaulis sibiricus]
MKHSALALAAAIVLGVPGVGLEVARPVLFLSEPLVVWTVPGEDSPRVSLGPLDVPLDWCTTWDGERTRWEGAFPAFSPPGVWMVCTDHSCEAFLRVPDVMGIVEVRALPGTALVLAGQEGFVGKTGWAWFVVPPGEHVLGASMSGQQSCYRVLVYPAERVTVSLVLASLGTSSGAVVPGHTVTLYVHLLSPRDLPSAYGELELPEGWEAMPLEGVHEPVRRGEVAVRCWRVVVPPSAAVGEYVVRMGFPDLGLEAQVPVVVTPRLSPREVVCHWDLAADGLDLSLPCRLTYDRLLWAATFVGQELPYTGRVFTQAELNALAAEWAAGP